MGFDQYIQLQEPFFPVQFDGLVGGVVNDYVRQKTLQGGRHIEDASGAVGAARPSDEANVPAYVGQGVNLVGPNGIILDPIHGNITNMKDLTQTTNTTKSLVQPFQYQASSISDLTTIRKTYVKLREVTLTIRSGKRIRQEVHHQQCLRFARGQEPVVLLPQQV